MIFEDRVARLRIEKHKGRETKDFLDDVIKMAQGEAFEYLMGEKFFCDVKIDLSMRPMIPRDETGFWVKEAIKKIQTERQETEELRILDLFAGSGCVGLAILKNISSANVVFVELDKKSEKQIDISLEKNKINKDRAMIVIEDCVKFLQDKDQKKFDLIFAVPPYVPPQMKDEVMEELHAEDPLYFFDKEDGLFYIKKVLQEATKLLGKDGKLFMEFDITQKDEVEKLLKENNIEKYSYLKDPYSHDCAVMIKNQ